MGIKENNEKWNEVEKKFREQEFKENLKMVNRGLVIFKALSLLVFILYVLFSVILYNIYLTFPDAIIKVGVVWIVITALVLGLFKRYLNRKIKLYELVNKSRKHND